MPQPNVPTPRILVDTTASVTDEVAVTDNGDMVTVRIGSPSGPYTILVGDRADITEVLTVALGALRLLAGPTS